MFSKIPVLMFMLLIPLMSLMAQGPVIRRLEARRTTLPVKIDGIINAYSITNPERSVPALAALYKDLASIKDVYWRTQKQKEVAQQCYPTNVTGDYNYVSICTRN